MIEVFVERRVPVVRLEVQEEEVVTRRPSDSIVDRAEGVAIHEVRYLFLSDLVFCVVLHAPEQETGAIEAYRSRHAFYALRSHDAGDVRMPPVEEQLCHDVFVVVEHVLSCGKIVYDDADALELTTWRLLGLEL